MSPLLVFVLLAAGGAPGQQSAATAEAREVRYLTFTARDSNRIYVRDLEREEVALSLDGEAVEVGYLGDRHVETAFVFLIENSPRTAPYGRSLPHRGEINIVDQVRYHLMDGFFQPLVALGPVLIAQFYRELGVLISFTDREDELEYALRRMRPHFSGLDRQNIPIGRMLGRGVDWLQQRRERRRILVLVTAAVDRDSYQHLEESREMLRRASVELYVISFAPRFPSGSGSTHAERMNGYYFRQLTGETAGKTYLAEAYARVSEPLDDLKARLSHSYTLGFYVRPEPEPRPHAVELRVERPGVRLTHRPRIVY